MDSSGPNVLCICLDSLRADTWSGPHADTETTPALAAFASTAATFRRAISPSVWTQPVHASLFTGLYPEEHGLSGGDAHLGEHPTYAEILHEAGYTTTAFGYNGWIETGDLLRGFDVQRTPHPLAGRRGMDRAFGRIQQMARRPFFRNEHRDRLTADRVIEHLRAVDDPFCVFVHLNGPHHNYEPPAPYHRRFTDTRWPTLATNVYRQIRLFNDPAAAYAGTHDVNAKDVGVMRGLYKGCIARTDALLGEILESLRQAGHADDTVVVIYGDHGESFGENDLFSHQYSVGDWLIRVPLVVRDPTNRLSAGEYEEIVQLNDIYPTILEFCGHDPPPTNSVSLDSSARDAAFVQYTPPVPVETALEDTVAPEARPPSHQYAVWQSAQDRLTWYPNEDRYDGPGRESGSLRELLDDHQTAMARVAPQPGERTDPAVERNLADMGYL